MDYNITREDIIRMAREAEIGDSHGYIIANELAHLERFAALVAAAERRGCERHFQVAMRNAVTAEREACAKVCESTPWTTDKPNDQ